MAKQANSTTKGEGLGESGGEIEKCEGATAKNLTSKTSSQPILSPQPHFMLAAAMAAFGRCLEIGAAAYGVAYQKLQAWSRLTSNMKTASVWTLESAPNHVDVDYACYDSSASHDHVLTSGMVSFSGMLGGLQSSHLSPPMESCSSESNHTHKTASRILYLPGGAGQVRALVGVSPFSSLCLPRLALFRASGPLLLLHFIHAGIQDRRPTSRRLAILLVLPG